MADIHWLNPVSGDFNTGTNWSSGTVPGISDNAILGTLGGTPYTVTDSLAGLQEVQILDVAANVTLVTQNTNFQALAGGANAGAIQVMGGDFLLDGASFANSGTVAIDGSALLFQGVAVTLTGAGQVQLNDPHDQFNAIGGGSLDNVNNTIVGSGEIGSAGPITITNGAAGVIDANGAGNGIGFLAGNMIIFRATVVNNGLIESTGTTAPPGNTYLKIGNGSVVDQAGGGTILAADGAVVALEQVSILGGTLTTVGTGVIDIGLNNTVLDGSASPLIDKATINVQATALTGKYEATLKGAIVNSGVINVDGASQTGNQTNLIVDPAGVTLTGAGSINLVAGVGTSDIVGMPGGSTLTNVDNTISGTGGVGGSYLSVINGAKGVIDANQAKDLDLVGAVTNAGLIEATVGALVAAGTISNAGGTIEANGGRVLLHGVDVAGGSVRSISGAVATYGSGSVLDGTTQAVTLAGALTVTGATGLTIEGAIHNGGRIDVAASTARPGNTDLIVGAAGATLSGGGRIVLTPLATSRVLGVSGTATLTNVDNRISGGGLIGAGVLSLINDAAGAIVGNTSAALTLNTGGKTIMNAGLINAAGAGVVIIDSAVANGGVLETQGGTMKVNAAVSGGGEAVVAGGRLDFVSTFSQNVIFGASGALELDKSQAYGGTVYGFSRTGATSIDLGDINFASASYTLGGNAIVTTLMVMDGTHSATIHLRGDYRSSTFNLTSDGHGGTIVTDPPKGAASAHVFIAAMAGLGTGAGVALHTAEPWRAPAAMLAGPRVCTA